MKQKILSFIASFLLLLVPISAFAQTVDPSFDANKLIDDKVFSDTQTFGSAQGIQKFLENKNSILANTSTDFLVKLKEPQITVLKEALEDPQPKLNRLRTAAELIWDASRQSGLNPQVILVTLQKEQSLITGRQTDAPEKVQRALDNAMGFGCPDATGCGDIFPGFYFQLFGNLDATSNRYLGAAKSLMKSFSTPGGRGPAINGTPATVGQRIAIQNTQGAPYYALPEQQVTIGNAATAALYRYTPHVFNGNYNFWRYFKEWFRYANGTLLKLKKDKSTYIIDNGTRFKIPDFVATARNINLSSAITVSSNEIASYPLSQTPYAPADNTIIKIADTDQTFVFINSVRRPASAFVITQRSLNPANAITVSKDEALLFGVGDQLAPSDGTVLRGQTDPAVYLVTSGKLLAFNATTFAQYKAAGKVQTVPDTEIASYPKAGFVPPLDGTVIKTERNQTVYAMSAGLKQPMTYEVFKNRKITPGQIVIVNDEEVASYGTDGFARPADRTFFQVGQGGPQYIYRDGSKHIISDYVAKQRGITPDFTFSQPEAASWPDGIAITPRDNTLVKGDQSTTVYVVLSGQLRPLTGQAFANRHYSYKNIVTLPQPEVDAYGKGELLAK